MAKKKVWFRVPDGKTHELVEDVEAKRFPLGRAKCAPFPRLDTDPVFDRARDISPNQFCRLCVLAK